MTQYFMDSNVLIGAFNPRDQYHVKASKLVEQIDEGGLGQVIVSDYVFDETLTFVRRRSGYEKSLEVLDSILSAEHLQIIKATEHDVQAAILLFEKYRSLSFTDAVIVAMMFSRDADNLISFDSGFDQVIGLTRLTKVPD